MKINIKATGVELTPAISDYAHKKISTIEKYFPTDKDYTDTVAQVEVGKSTHHHKSGNVFRAEVHITGGGLDLYAVSEQTDLYAAIDMVRDEIYRNLMQDKGKHQTITRKGAEMMKNMMKGITSTTAMAGRAAGRGLSWSLDRLKFKGLRSFKKRP